jgi:hypothetical protein
MALKGLGDHNRSVAASGIPLDGFRASPVSFPVPAGAGRLARGAVAVPSNVQERGFKMKKAIIAGIVGGIIMFLWGFISHVALGLYDHSMKQIPNEEAVMSVMRANIKEPGFYFFPGMDLSGKLPKEQAEKERAAVETKYETGAHGILIYRVNGERMMSPKQLSIQFANDIVWESSRRYCCRRPCRAARAISAGCYS